MPFIDAAELFEMYISPYDIVCLRVSLYIHWHWVPIGTNCYQPCGAVCAKHRPSINYYFVCKMQRTHIEWRVGWILASAQICLFTCSRCRRRRQFWHIKYTINMHIKHIFQLFVNVTRRFLWNISIYHEYLYNNVGMTYTQQTTEIWFAIWGLHIYIYMWRCVYNTSLVIILLLLPFVWQMLSCAPFKMLARSIHPLWSIEAAQPCLLNVKPLYF